MNRYLIALIFSFLTGPAYSDNYPRNENIDVRHYDFRIELNDTTNVVRGEATVTILFKRPVTDFELDLVNQKVAGMGMKITRIMLNKTSLKYTHQNDRVKITLPAIAKTGDVLSFIIDYGGTPQDGLIISKNKFGDRTFFGDNWPDRARYWLPSIDHPYDKASVDFIVLAPPYYEVVSNGIKTEESYLNQKQKLTHWHEEADIPTKVMTVGVARFAVQLAGSVRNIPVESWVFPQVRLEGFQDYAPAVRILDFFISHIGPYPYEKLANIQSKTRWGGMENASAIFYEENSVQGKGDTESLMAHEIAHQWFGNSVSENDWYHVWLSEGFATYFAHLYNEFTFGVERRMNDMREDREQVISYSKSDYFPIINTAISDYNQALNVNSYQKGSWVLHMLRKKIGNDTFWKGIRTYYDRFKGGNAMTADFQRVMEEASGQDLSTFFERWVYRGGLPQLAYSWTYNPGTNVVNITVKQMQKGSLFDLPLEIGIYLENKDLPVIPEVQVDKGLQNFTFKVEGKPLKIILDPYVNLLFEQKSLD